MNSQSVLNVEFSLEGKKTVVGNIEKVASCPFCGTKNLSVLSDKNEGEDAESLYLAVHPGCKDKKRKLCDFFKNGDRVNLLLRNVLQEGVFVIEQLEYHEAHYISVRLQKSGHVSGRPLGFRYDYILGKWYQQHVSDNGLRCVHRNSKKRLYTIQKIHEK